MTRKKPKGPKKVLTTHPIRTDKHAGTRPDKKKEPESIVESPCKDDRNESIAKGKDKGKSQGKHFSEAPNNTSGTAVISVKTNSKEHGQKKSKSTNIKVVEESNIENEKVKVKHKSKAKAETKIENETQNAVSASGKRSKKSSNEVKEPAISVPPCQGENEKGKKSEKANRKNNMPIDKEMPAEKDTEKKVEIETEEHVHKKSKKSKKNKK